MLERGPRGEARGTPLPAHSVRLWPVRGRGQSTPPAILLNPQSLNPDAHEFPTPRPLSSPIPRECVPTDGDWQLQVPPGAPGTARQGPTRIIMLVNDGGTATQPRAPGHERPHAALRAARHGRLSAASTAPGADIPRATSARAPGQYCQSAALRAPGHGRPLAITAGAPVHDRLSAALRAPGADLLLASTAKAAGQHRPSAAPIATVALPAGQHRLRQEGLPRVPANPRTHTHQDTTHTRATHSHRDTVQHRAACSQTPSYAKSHPTVASLRRKPQFSLQRAAFRRANSPSLRGKGPGDRSKPHHTWHYPCGFGPSAGRSRPQPTHQVHPAIQVPSHPRSCSTAATGFPRHRCRAPPLPPAESPPVADYGSRLARERA